MTAIAQAPVSIPMTPSAGFGVTIWIWNDLDSAPQKRVDVPSAQIISEDQISWSGPLRIISAPRDLMKQHPKQAFKNLFEHFKVPRQFELERRQAVNHGIGTHFHSESETNVTWFRLVSKNVNIVEDRQTGRWNIQGSDIFSDRTWFDSSYVLIEQKGWQGVTLLCFGISESLTQRFDELRPDQELSEQPWSILVEIFETLFVDMDEVVWRLSDVFRSTEEDTLQTAKRFEGSSSALFNFPQLHNISKHCIYLTEGFEAAREVVHALVKAIEHESGSGTGNAMRNLRHAAQLFKSSQLRLASLEGRISNITNLSFNIVAQRDSRRMGRDSRSMNTIAVMTLVFLPSTLIATLFGSNFFDFGLEDENVTGKVRVSGLFWIFWAISLPSTGLVMTLWLMRARVGQGIDATV